MAAQKKKMTEAQKNSCRIITPMFRVSYPHVFNPQSPKEGDTKKFSITMLFPKDSDLMGLGCDPEDDNKLVKPMSLKKAVLNAKVAYYGPKENWPDDLLSPWIDGDDPKQHKKGKKEGYHGHWVLKANSSEDSKPGLVDAEGTPITEKADFYAGCYARAFVFAYRWEFMGKEGIGFILDHVQKLKEGKAFGGKKPIDQVFGPVNTGDDDESEEEESFL